MTRPIRKSERLANPGPVRGAGQEGLRQTGKEHRAEKARNSARGMRSPSPERQAAGDGGTGMGKSKDGGQGWKDEGGRQG